MNVKDIIKYRLKAGAMAVVENLKYVDVNDLIFNLYLPIKDDDTKKLITFYEKTLVLAKIDPNKFKNTRYKQIKEITHWIKKNNKYRLFTDFSMYVFRNMNQKNKNVLISYMNSLMDTWVNLSPYGYYWYGLDLDNTPLFISELYGAYDEKIYDWVENTKKNSVSKEKIILNILEYNKEIEFIRTNEKNITNILFGMIGLINKSNEKFIFPYRNWYNHVKSLPLPRIYKPTDYYLELLDKRNYFLNSEGVIIQCYNSGLFKEIRFKEEFLDDGLVVLFRVTDVYESKYTMGFIDLRNKFLFSGWMSANEGKQYHENFMNFVLEVYCYLVCGFDQSVNRLAALKQLSNLSEVTDLNNNQPGIYIEVKDKISKSTKDYTITQKAFHKVSGHLRKGNASEMSKANARLYGLSIIPQGYTFVRPHTRGIKK